MHSAAAFYTAQKLLQHCKTSLRQHNEAISLASICHFVPPTNGSCIWIVTAQPRIAWPASFHNLRPGEFQKVSVGGDGCLGSSPKCCRILVGWECGREVGECCSSPVVGHKGERQQACCSHHIFETETCRYVVVIWNFRQLACRNSRVSCKMGSLSWTKIGLASLKA
uniref:Uncharacterized protein n=1 Tax=Micrurus corallinus TaxID=54390 RepID=A0A2D4GBG4_MICCO